MASDSFFHVGNITGKPIIKVQLGDDTRVIPLYNEDITYDELLLMFQRVFSGKLKGSDEVVLKYRDQDNDLVTLASNEDLAFAKQLTKYLRIVIFVNGSEVPPVTVDTVHKLKKELVRIRDRVNELLNIIDSEERPSVTCITASSQVAVIQEQADQDVRSKGDDRTADSDGALKPQSLMTLAFDPLSGAKSSDPFAILGTVTSSHNPPTTTSAAKPVSLSEATHIPTQASDVQPNTGSTTSNLLSGSGSGSIPVPTQDQGSGNQPSFTSKSPYPPPQQTLPSAQPPQPSAQPPQPSAQPPQPSTQPPQLSAQPTFSSQPHQSSSAFSTGYPTGQSSAAGYYPGATSSSSYATPTAPPSGAMYSTGQPSYPSSGGFYQGNPPAQQMYSSQGPGAQYPQTQRPGGGAPPAFRGGYTGYQQGYK